MQNLSISIIVPIHVGQDSKILKACLDSLLQASPPPFEIILVSDGKMVPLPEVENPSRILQLETTIKLGPSVARNLGATHASGEILCFIDSDVVVPPDLVQLVRHEFQKNPSADALFGSYDAAPFMPNFLSQYRNLLHHYIHQTGKEDASTFWAGCGAIRREIFLEAGGFNGNRFPHPSVEDIDLGYRLINAGHFIRLAKNIQVKHLKKWQALSMIKVDFFHRALPWTKLLLEKKELANDLNIKITDRLSVTAVFLIIAVVLLSFCNPLFVTFLIPVFLLFLLLNYKLYKFYLRNKGGLFTLKVIPWQIIFYFLSGLGFIVGIASYYLLKPKYE